jgi:hypothetical protein
MMATFFDSPNSIIFIGLTFGFISMTVGAIIACILKLDSCEICGCRSKTNMDRIVLDLEAEIQRLRGLLKPDKIPELTV